MASTDYNDDLYSQDYPWPSAPIEHPPDLPSNEAPTYSTWKYRGGELIPMKHRSPSPLPSPGLSSERQEFDRTLEDTNLERDQNADREHDERMARMFRKELEWRVWQYTNAEQQREMGRPYRYLRPWALELRRQCVPFGALLNDYYGLEAGINQSLQERLTEIKDMLMAGWDIGEQTRTEFQLLCQVESARIKDREDRNDFCVLEMVLNKVEKRLEADIKKLFDGMSEEDGEVQELVTELPTHISQAVCDHPELKTRFSDLKDLERDLFPSRFTTPNSIFGNADADTNADGSMSPRDHKVPLIKPLEDVDKKRKTEEDIDKEDSGKDNLPWIIPCIKRQRY
ncbi:hypothetical protein K505DRAFT_320076 [Melanomma pulvis-pyrius CBS 109.77]|uniref:Uncharacterized protein n=1 Tax=Melanomma pulvis-pyrius CBS 109.77 TaxID=1314802 RepID=A0A6A6XWR7_9PLEO|nr:hypothetical protein K505DRAFT_320076 [Melanomma pulvis-pyrius CBS 109.77]